MKKLFIVSVAILALLVMIAGCTATAGVAGGPNIDSIAAEIMSGQTATTSIGGGMNVRVSIDVTDFTVVDIIGESANVTSTGQDSGYFVYYLEPLSAGSMIPTTTPTATPTATTTAPATATTTVMPTAIMTPGQESMSFASTETSYIWEDIEPGTYVFWVQLVDENGEALMPAVAAAAVLIVPMSDGGSTAVPATTTTTRTTTAATTTTTTTTSSTATTTP